MSDVLSKGTPTVFHYSATPPRSLNYALPAVVLRLADVHEQAVFAPRQAHVVLARPTAPKRSAATAITAAATTITTAATGSRAEDVATAAAVSDNGAIILGAAVAAAFARATGLGGSAGSASTGSRRNHGRVPEKTTSECSGTHE